MQAGDTDNDFVVVILEEGGSTFIERCFEYAIVYVVEDAQQFGHFGGAEF